MTSDDYLEPGSTSVVVYAPARFHDGSPTLYAATAKVFEEAITWINAHPREAAELYVAREPQKNGVDWIEKMIRDPKLVRYDGTPRGLKVHADFMHEDGGTSQSDRRRRGRLSDRFRHRRRFRTRKPRTPHRPERSQQRQSARSRAFSHYSVRLIKPPQ